MPTSSNAVVAPLVSKGLVKKTKAVREDVKGWMFSICDSRTVFGLTRNVPSDPFAALFEKESRIRVSGD